MFEVCPETARKELGIFFQVAEDYRIQTGQPAFMPACLVDSEWHRLLDEEDSSEYQELCQASVRRDHVGHESVQGHGRIGWVSTYEKLTGRRLPAIWFHDTCGVLNQAALDRYQETGEVELSWDCAPS